MQSKNIILVKSYLNNLQDNICKQLEQEDASAKFIADNWQANSESHGSTRIASNGKVIEHAAVNFSYVYGSHLPPSASERYPQLAGCPFHAMGVSLIIHPLNPYVPTTHANIRFINAYTKSGESVWWFGGGYDLTPYYPFLEDCIFWHLVAKQACDPFGADLYPKLKDWCDKYFYLPHRNETRGIGGLFFDDLNQWTFEKSFAFMQSVGNSFCAAYLPIVNKRKNIQYTEAERDFQLYRRGRYVEFNLLYDRGTLFGLQAKGRTESILASLPPNVKWRYNWQPNANSPEAKLHEYLKPRNWLNERVLANHLG